MYQTPIHRLNSWLSFLFSGTLRVMIVNKKLFRQLYSNLRTIKLVIQTPLHRLNSWLTFLFSGTLRVIMVRKPGSFDHFFQPHFFPPNFDPVILWDRPFGLHPSTAAFYKHFLFYFHDIFSPHFFPMRPIGVIFHEKSIKKTCFSNKNCFRFLWKTV